MTEARHIAAVAGIKQYLADWPVLTLEELYRQYGAAKEKENDSRN